ncbi:unnamed protein product, partial [Ectocarpus sp. 13 AM-2016]
RPCRTTTLYNEVLQAIRPNVVPANQLSASFRLRPTSAQASTHAPPSVWCHRT